MAQTKTSSTFANYLKTHYGPNVNEELLKGYNNDAIKFVFDGKIRAGGKNFTEPIRVRPASGSTAWHTESGATPTAAEPTDTVAYDSIKFMSTAKEVTQHMLNLTKVGGLTFRKAIDDLNQDAITEHRNDIYRALFALKGYVGICSSADNTGKIITMGTGTNMDQFYVGQSVEVLRISDNLHNSVGSSAATTITAVTPATPSISLTAAVQAYQSVSSSYGVALGGVFSSGTNRSCVSIPDIVSSTTTGPATLHNITVASYPEWVSYYKSIAGTLDPKDVQAAIDDCEMLRGGALDIILGHMSVVREYQFDLIDPKVMIMNEGSRDAGTGAVYYKGRSNKRLPVVAAAFCNPTDALFGIDKSSIRTMYTALTEWMSDDNGQVLHKKSGYSYYEATLGSEFQLLGYARYKNFCLDNIT